MTKPIPRKMHAALDYGYAALFAAAPRLFAFDDEETAARLARIVGGVVAATSLCTRYELGVLGVLPFKAHLAADVAVGLLAIGAPFAAGFADHRRARRFFIAMGAFSVLAGLLTEPSEPNENDA